jgi:chemotaxis protein MotB
MAGDDKPKVIIKRKKGGHAAHHGGAWKVAYADFVTAMMALFMVLWLLTQADMRLRQQIAQYFRDPGIMPGGSMLDPERNEAKSREPQVVGRDVIVVQGRAEQELLKGAIGDLGAEAKQRKAEEEQKRLEGQAKALEEAVNKAAAESPDLAPLRDQVIIQVTDAGLSIQVVDKGRNLLFDLSSAELKPPLVAMLKQIGVVLGKLPNNVQIGGHTDSRPYPPAAGKTNWELSFERANNARKILEGNGLRPGQIKRVLAFADTQPLVPDNPLADENRRLSVLAERKGPPPGAAPATAGADGPIVLPPDQPPSHAGAPG